MRVGQEIQRYKMKKRFQYAITDTSFSFWRTEHSIAQEAALDGIYIIRTSLGENDMTNEQCVRNYKTLTRVERAFRTLQTVSLRVRPLHHRTADRVRAHIFLCVLAYYVEWHMRQAWRELLFADTQLDEKAQTRDPVLPAPRPWHAARKAASTQLEDGSPAYCFTTLMEHLGSIVRNTHQVKPDAKTVAGTETVFETTTTANEKQQKALQLLSTIGDL